MTPAQEAKEFAAAHGFVIQTIDGTRRYDVARFSDGCSIAEVGGYPAALNAMKRWVTDNVPQGWAAPTLEAALGNDSAADSQCVESGAGAADIGECAASGTSCSYGAWGRDGERQCKYCGKVQDMLDPAANIGEVPIASGAVFDTPVYAQQYGRAKRYMTIEEARSAASANPAPHHPWRVWQRIPGNEGRWHQLLAFSNRAEAVKYCRQLANIRSLRNLTREIRYEV